MAGEPSQGFLTLPLPLSFASYTSPMLKNRLCCPKTAQQPAWPRASDPTDVHSLSRRPLAGGEFEGGGARAGELWARAPYSGQLLLSAALGTPRPAPPTLASSSSGVTACFRTSPSWGPQSIRPGISPARLLPNLNLGSQLMSLEQLDNWRTFDVSPYH